MGSTSFLTKSKSAGFKPKSGSSVGSDKEMNGKLRRAKIRRPGKMNEYGLKRIPDYTELAYKEAVSKLRYFLSGNYAPSVRSYGGSASIKNLDESDGDLDKKYSTYALSEYKPRPRLTAKYSTLYADSLNNSYTPNLNHVPPPPTTTSPPADLTGGTNPDVIHFIQKQEEYIEQLERESQYCRDELNNLLGKVKEVISENEHLHEAQKNKLISRMFHTYNNGSETDELDDVGDSTGLDSDNKATPSKARKAAKPRSSKLEGPNIVFESRIAELEAQLTQSKIDLKKVQEENNENKRKLASGLVDSTCLDGFKRQIDNLQRDKNALEAQISRLKLSLEQKDGDEGRYKRSDVLEQQLREERNSLEIEVRRLKDELGKERSKVRELAGEGARRAVQERSAAEQRYTAHFDELQRDLAGQYDAVAKLQLDLERQRREENDLKRELSMKNSTIDELKMDLKNKTASLQADLAQAHAEKASLDEELASARLVLERQQRQAKHETNRLNSEIQSLRQRLDRADADLVHSRRENLRLSEQIATLEKEINMKNLSPISPEKKKKEKEFSTMLESMENKHARTVAELESMVHSQNSLMEKLTGECRLLTDKLDDANRRHKTEKTQLLCRNAELMRKLRNLWSSHKKYCTTLPPLRSYTPLSGYPNSRSSYDLDRTYYTSTPFTYRNRYKKDYENSDIGNLNRYLSDLSLDRFGDSDDDPLKVRNPFREELGTLQRQVERLGRSMQDQASTPSVYQAPTTHAPTANRNSHPTSDTGRDDPRADSAGDASRTGSGNQPVTNIRPDRVDTHEQNPRVSRQPSITTLPDQNIPVLTNDNLDAIDVNYEERIDHSDDNKDSGQEKSMEAENQNQVPGYDDGNYDQNYRQDEEYQNQYDQQGYTEGQYENYEQYPQYTDPNTQYEQPDTQYEQYQNYGTEGNNYEGDQNYDNAQFDASQEFTPQYDQTEPNAERTEVTQNKISNSPNEELTKS